MRGELAKRWAYLGRGTGVLADGLQLHRAPAAACLQGPSPAARVSHGTRTRRLQSKAPLTKWIREPRASEDREVGRRSRIPLPNCRPTTKPLARAKPSSAAVSMRAKRPRGVRECCCSSLILARAGCRARRPTFTFLWPCKSMQIAISFAVATGQKLVWCSYQIHGSGLPKTIHDQCMQDIINKEPLAIGLKSCRQLPHFPRSHDRQRPELACRKNPTE